MTSLSELKKIGVAWCKALRSTRTKPGSITYLLFGERISTQSINIKFGYFGEILLKNIIKSNKKLLLLQCGVQEIQKSKIDVDLIWLHTQSKTIYIREVKSKH